MPNDSRPEWHFRLLGKDLGRCPSLIARRVVSRHSGLRTLRQWVRFELFGTLHLAWYDPDNTLGNEPDVAPAHNGHGRRDNAEDVELIEGCASFSGFSLPRTARACAPHTM